MSVADLRADVVHDSQPADAFEQLLPFEFVQRARHDADVNPAVCRTHQPLDDDHVLVALVLQPERFLRAVDEVRDALAAVVRDTRSDQSRASAANGCSIQSASKQRTISATSRLLVVSTA